MYEKYGEIKEVFNLIEGRGMIFVTFVSLCVLQMKVAQSIPKLIQSIKYDIRAARRAKEATQGMVLRGRKIDVHYSLPKEEEENAKCDRTKNQVPYHNIRFMKFSTAF